MYCDSVDRTVRARMLTLRRAARRDEGFTLLETVAVLAITCVLLGSAVAVSSKMLEQSRSDSSTHALVNTLGLARTRAIGERRNFHIAFVMPNRIQISRVQVPSNALQLVTDVVLDNGFEFRRFSGQPDTPDAFGAVSATSFGASPRRLFTSEASFVDNTGNVLNGSIFIGRPGEPMTARAITIFGVTALVRTWKWTGTQWVE